MPGKISPSPSNDLRRESTASLLHNLTDASEQAACQHWLDIDMHQLSAGQYQGSCASLSMDKIHLVHEGQNQSVQKTGIMPENMCTVSLAYSTNPALRFSQFSDPMDSWLFFLPEQTEFDVNVPANVETLYIGLEQDKLLDAARSLNEEYWTKPPSDLHAFNTSAAQQLGADLAALLTSSSTADINPDALMSTTCGKMLVDCIVMALNSSTEVLTGKSPEYQARRRVHQLVSTAREFIETSLQARHIPSIVELCAQTGVSERTLQYAFRQVMQISPITYLRILRLNKVRADLLTAVSQDVTVTRVATNWGFLHLGKFSQDYRRMFNERPSETLARTISTL